MLNTCAEKFKRLLEDKEFNFKSGIDNDGDSYIFFPYNGKNAQLFFTAEDGKYLSIYLCFEKVPEDKVTDVIFACNEMNIRFKWVTFYVDKDNDVMLHLDELLSVEHAEDEAFELLLRLFNICDDAKPIIMKAIYA